MRWFQCINNSRTYTGSVCDEQRRAQINVVKFYRMDNNFESITYNVIKKRNKQKNEKNIASESIDFDLINTLKGIRFIACQKC